MLFCFICVSICGNYGKGFDENRNTRLCNGYLFNSIDWGYTAFCVGIMGEYLARTYLEAKHRPLFVQRNKIDYKNMK